MKQFVYYYVVTAESITPNTFKNRLDKFGQIKKYCRTTKQISTALGTNVLHTNYFMYR